jgi:hypothetical protein
MGGFFCGGEQPSELFDCQVVGESHENHDLIDIVARNLR